jgi:hypothetical protein
MGLTNDRPEMIIKLTRVAKLSVVLYNRRNDSCLPQLFGALSRSGLGICQWAAHGALRAMQSSMGS